MLRMRKITSKLPKEAKFNRTKKGENGTELKKKNKKNKQTKTPVKMTLNKM